MSATIPDPDLDGPVDPSLLTFLQQLLALPTMALIPTLNQSSDLLSAALGAEKIDVMLYDSAIHSLVAVGASDTPLARRQRQLGLDRLPLAAGGRHSAVYATGVGYVTSQAADDPELERGLADGLGLRALIVVPLVIAGERRGVLSVSSTRPAAFTASQRQLCATVAPWIGMVIQRAELMDQLTQAAAAQARQDTAEDVITILAHDLGNYLTPLRGRLDLVLRRVDREYRARDVHDLRAARDTVDRLERLIGNLLDVSRLRHGRLAIAPSLTDLVHLAREATRLLAMPDHPVTVTGADECCVLVDGSRMQQVLENLLTNAMKHTPPGTPIQVAVDTNRQNDDDWAVLMVADRGPGIPPDQLPTLFTRFVHGATSHGLGLGLFLAHGIVTAHGGTLTVTSTLGQGSAFQIRLPLPPDPPVGPVG